MVVDMGYHIKLPILMAMKTTVEISDHLLEEVRKVAAREGVTLRMLIERGLYTVLRETRTKSVFKLRRAGVTGHGLQPEFSGASWEDIRDAIYRGRGA
jgi:hypothetical protein